MEWESDSPCCSHTYPGQGTQVSWKVQQLGAGFWGLWRNPRARAAVDCGEMDWIKGMWGGDCGGKCLWKKARKPLKQGNTAESRIVVGAITIASLSPHTSISSWAIERLAHQMPDKLNYRAGPHPGCSFKWLKCWSTGPQPGVPPLCAWCAEQRRTPGKGAL